MTIGKVEALNDFWTRCHLVYLDRSNRIKNAKIWCMDESGFNDKDNSKKGWGLKGDINQTQQQSTGGSDTFVACVSNTGDTLSYFIKHTAATVEYDADGDRNIQKGVKGMNTNVMRDWVTHFLKIAKDGDILVMDNLKCHHSNEVVKKIRAAGISIIYTPARLAYLVSPLDNFIFGYMKNKWRQWLSSMNGHFTKEEKQEFLFEVFQQVKHSELLMASFMRCGLPSYHPQLRLDINKPIEQHVNKGQFSELDTEWYKSSPTAQLMREKRVMTKLYDYLYFADISIICSTVQADTTNMIAKDAVAVETAETEDDRMDSGNIFAIESVDEHQSILFQLQQGKTNDIIIPTMMYNIDLVDYLAIRKEEYENEHFEVFLSNQHTALNLLKKKIIRLQSDTGLYQIIHDCHHFCGISVFKQTDTLQIIIYDSLIPMSSKLLYRIEEMINELQLSVIVMRKLQQVDSTSCGWFQLAFANKMIELRKENTDPLLTFEKMDYATWVEYVDTCKHEFMKILVEDYQSLMSDIDSADVQSQIRDISQQHIMSIDVDHMSEENTHLVDEVDSSSDDDIVQIDTLVNPKSSITITDEVIQAQSILRTTDHHDEERQYINNINGKTSQAHQQTMTTEHVDVMINDEQVMSNTPEQYKFSSTLRIIGAKAPVYSNQFDKDAAHKKAIELYSAYIATQTQQKEDMKRKLEEIHGRKRKLKAASSRTSDVTESIDHAIMNQRTDKQRTNEHELRYQKSKRKKPACISFPALDSFESEEDFDETLSCLNYTSLQRACKQNGLHANRKAVDLKVLLSEKFKEVWEAAHERHTDSINDSDDGDDVMDDEYDDNFMQNITDSRGNQEEKNTSVPASELPNFLQLFTMLGNTQTDEDEGYGTEQSAV